MLFLTIEEIITSIQLGVIYSITSLGIYITLRIINFPDLTCDGSFALGTAVTGILIHSGYNPWIALIGSFLAGSAAGYCTGILNIKCKITNLLSGILVTFILYSINFRIMNNNSNISLIDLPTIFDGNQINAVLFIVMAPILAIALFLAFSHFGLTLKAIGYNPQFALNKGININSSIIIALMISNAIIAFSGGIIAQYQGFADMSQGIGTIIVGLAAIIIGEQFLQKEKIITWIINCFLGAILYRLLIALSLYNELLGLNTNDLNLVTGTIIILIMIISKNKNVNTQRHQF